MKFKRTWTSCLHSWELLGQPGNAGPLAPTFTGNTTYEPCLTLPCPSHVLTSLLPHLQFHGQALKLFPSLCHRLCFKGFQKPKRNCIFTLDKLEYSNPYANCLCVWLSIVIHCGDAAYFTNYLLRRIWGASPVACGKESAWQCRGLEFDPWLGNKDPTCHGATKPVSHSYWACAIIIMCVQHWKDPAWHNEGVGHN